MFSFAVDDCNVNQPDVNSQENTNQTDTRWTQVEAKETQADVNSQDSGGWTQLHWSSYRGQQSKCQDLIAKGADVNLPDLHGYTPLFVASRQGHYDITKLLLLSLIHI